MSLVVENESPLPTTVTENDKVAVNEKEGSTLSLDSCAAIHWKQATFCQALDWSGAGKDTERVVPSPKLEEAIVVVIHKIPCLAVCTLAELSEPWKGLQPLMRITTMTFVEGDLDYIVEGNEKSIGEWVHHRPWCGQTVFTFPSHAYDSPDWPEVSCDPADPLPDSEKEIALPTEELEMIFAVKEP